MTPLMLRLPIWTLIFSGIFFGFTLPGGAPPAHAGDSEFRGPHGTVSQSFDSFIQPLKSTPNIQERFEADCELQLTHQAWSARATPWGWLRAPDAVGGDFKKARGYFELKEGWLEYSSDAWDLRAGNQILAWGAADFLNPTDSWNPRDFYDPFASTKLPLPVARLNVHPKDWGSSTLELDFTPFFRGDRLPVEFPESGVTGLSLDQSRWLIPAPTTVVDGGLTVPLHYLLAAPNYPAKWQGGARLMLNGIGNWDLAFSYFNGVEKQPRIAITKKGTASDPNLPVTATLNPSFHREQRVGVNAVGSLKPAKGELIGMRAEVAYVFRDNSRVTSLPADQRADLIKDDYIHSVLGFDHTLSKKFLDTVIYANLMYVHFQRIGHRETPTGEGVVSGLPNVNPWDDDLVLYVESRISSGWKIGASWLTSLQNGDHFLRPKIEKQFQNSLKLVLGADFFLGRDSGFYGQFRSNDRVTTQLAYFF